MPVPLFDMTFMPRFPVSSQLKSHPSFKEDPRLHFILKAFHMLPPATRFIRYGWLNHLLSPSRVISSFLDLFIVYFSSPSPIRMKRLITSLLLSSTGSGAWALGQGSRLLQLLAVWPRASCLTFLCLVFLTFKIKIIIVLPSEGCDEVSMKLVYPNAWQWIHCH